MTIRITAYCLRPIFWLLELVKPLIDLFARIWVAQVFFYSGLVKYQAFQATIYLFANTYKVPFLSPVVGAWLATTAELLLPVLLVIGLGGRIMILIFFVYNAIVAISYPFLWTTQGYMALTQHIAWALVLGLLMCHGPGKLSLDYLIRLRHGHHLERKPKEMNNYE
ncbi:MAG: DoxX family protein [Gammaproteobacteria bacterium]|nr:DoxX family protein [Gammaproteobacteria bacterium]MCH9744662.1 DoxX family protein [Gammaproteobacteria bacterium]